MVQSHKVQNVPLEEALDLAGVGCYTKRVMVTAGLMVFSALLGMDTMSVVIPAADCHLHLTTSQKGFLTSCSFSGMIFSSHLMGFFADSCGRKRVMLACNNLTVLLTVLSSLSPDPYTLMVVTFLNGFALGGVFSPAYVFVSEFCPASARTTGLLVCTAIASLATVYLPAVAWFIMPLEVHIPLFGDTAFTSWRLYLALLALPNLGTNFLLRCLPETPKFVLNAGDHEQTMDILRTIYAANMRKEKHEYPVESVILDATDQQSLEKETTSLSRNERSYLRIMIEQAVTLFTPPFLLGMLMACGIIFGVVGTYNMIALWIPEHTRQLMLYADGQPYSNATLCQVLTRNLHQQALEEEAVESGGGICEIDYQIFLASLIVGLLQSSFFLIMSLVAHKVKGKTLIIIFTLLTIGALFNLIFVKSFYLTLIGLATAVTLLISIFPLCYGLAVDIFPTSLRSTATSIIMLCGRIGSAVGNQVVGILLSSHCTAAYWGMILIQVGVIICTIFIPINRK